MYKEIKSIGIIFNPLDPSWAHAQGPLKESPHIRELPIFKNNAHFFDLPCFRFIADQLKS